MTTSSNIHTNAMPKVRVTTFSTFITVNFEHDGGSVCFLMPRGVTHGDMLKAVADAEQVSAYA